MLLTVGVVPESAGSVVVAESVPPDAEPVGDVVELAGSGGVVSYGAGGLEPLVPARVLDTREGNGAPKARVGAGGVVELQVAGRGGVPAVGAGAVVLNVTAVAATASSFVTVWPKGAARPLASNLNVGPGDTVPNLVVVKLGAGGKVSLFNVFGEMDLIADVAGWFPEGEGLEPLVPARVLDTREGNGAPKARVGAGGVVELQVAGRGGVPAVGAGAVVLNVTAVAATASSFVTVWPKGAARPLASNLNVGPGDTVPNLVVVKLGAGGKVSLFNAFGEMDLIADVAGWFPEGEGLEPLVPARVLDTREGNGAPKARVGAGGVVELQVAGRGGVPAVGAGAVVLNVTAVAATASSFVTVWPKGAARPLASNLNVGPGDTVPNLVVVKLGAGGKVSLFNAFGEMDLIADVAGWFPEGETASTAMKLLTGTVLSGSGDVVSYTGTSDTGAFIVMASSADIPAIGGHLAVLPHARVPSGLSGLVTNVTRNPNGTTTLVLTPANLQDMFKELEVHGAFDTDLDAIGDQSSLFRPTENVFPNFECGAGVTLGSLPSFSLGSIGGSFDFDLSERWARMVATFTPSVSWKLSSKIAFNCTATILKDKVVGVIGPMVFDAGVSLSVSASTAVSSADIGGSIPIRLGFEYKDGDTKNLSSYDIVGKGDGSAADVAVSLGFAITQKGKALGIAGLSASIGPKLTAKLAATGCFKLDGALIASLSAEFGRWMFKWDVKLADFALGPWTIYKKGCGGKMWTGTITVTNKYTYTNPSTNDPIVITTAEGHYTLLPASVLAANGAGSYTARVSGSGGYTVDTWCPQTITKPRTPLRSVVTTWSIPGVTRVNAINLGYDGPTGSWKYRPGLIFGYLNAPGDSGEFFHNETKTSCPSTLLPPQKRTYQDSTLGWSSGTTLAAEPLKDDDAAPEHLAGTTTWGLGSGPAREVHSNVGVTEYTYTVTYDLWLIDI